MTNVQETSATLRAIRAIGERLGLVERRIADLERRTAEQGRDIDHADEQAEEAETKADDVADQLRAQSTRLERVEAVAQEARKAAKSHPYAAATMAVLAGSGGALEVIGRWVAALWRALGEVARQWVAFSLMAAAAIGAALWGAP